MSILDMLVPDQPESDSGSIGTGYVKENWDEDYPGMVKVEYMYGETGVVVSDWLPAAVPYGGAGYGFYMLPEPGDKVILAFVEGRRDKPVVIGSLRDMDAALVTGTADEDNSKKVFQSKSGHQIMISEEDEKESLTVKTPAGQSIVIDDDTESVALISGDVSLCLNGEGNSITLKADKIVLEAESTLTLSGDQAGLEGGTIKVKADTGLNLESGGTADLKGSIVKLN